MIGMQGKSGHFPATFKYSLMNFQIHMNALQCYPEKIYLTMNDYLGKRNYIEQKLMQHFNIC
jgi:hypothetical protein